MDVLKRSSPYFSRVFCQGDGFSKSILRFTITADCFTKIFGFKGRGSGMTSDLRCSFGRIRNAEKASADRGGWREEIPPVQEIETHFHPLLFCALESDKGRKFWGTSPANLLCEPLKSGNRALVLGLTVCNLYHGVGNSYLINSKKLQIGIGIGKFSIINSEELHIGNFLGDGALKGHRTRYR